MTVFLHAAFRDDRLWLWGETGLPDGSPDAPPSPRGRRPKTPRPGRNPFDSGAEVLDDLFADLGIGDGVEVETALLWLPTAAGRPVASSPVIGPIPAGDEPVSLATWETTGFPLPAPDAIELLTRVGADAPLAPGLFPGADLLFWASAMRFAGALVARGRLLPDLVRRDGKAHARWRPAFLGRDAQALARLAQAMPDAARAIGTARAPPDAAAVAVLREFLGSITDALVRGDAVPAVRKALAASVDEGWLGALTGADAQVRGDAAALAELERRLADWRRPVAVMAASPVRLCFRLEEPPPDPEPDPDAEEQTATVAVADGPWTVRYLLQSHHDPSLLVPVPDAWDRKAEATRLLNAGSGGADLREFLLLSFAQAGRLSPAIEASLKGGVPHGFETDATGAVEFLTGTAAALDQAGFGVLLPSWWAGRGTRTRITSRAKVRAPKMQGGGGLALEDLVKFDWEVALGDQTLSARDLAALARLKTPLVRVRGQWVLLDAAEIKAAAERLKRRGQEMTARDLVRVALGGGREIAAEGIDAQGWIRDLLDRLTGRAPLEDLPVPPGVEATLRPYQRRGVSWLGFLRRWGLGACLADDMGLGKTLQTLTLLQHEKDRATAEGRARPTTLLVCPTSVVANWQREAARFTPDLAVMVHHGTGRTRTAAALRRDCKAHDLVVTSYALLQRDAEVLKAVPWAGVILDEAQNIKNPETKQAKAARLMPAGFRVALTGTPVENNVGDLWSVMEFLNPGFLGTQAAFKRDFFVPIQTARDADAIARLKSLTGPFVLRRLKTDRSIIDDLPDKQEMKVFCTLTREQASLYAAVVEESLRELEEADGIRRKGLVLATLAKLKQVCNHPAQFLGETAAGGGAADRSGKLTRLEEMLEEVLSVGERALLFTQFTEMGDIVKARLQDRFGREVLFLHGGVAKPARDRMVQRFQTDDGPPIFLLSLKAGGTGLTLTAANHVFHIDRWWNPAVEDQATDRAFRIGQKRNVQVHKFVCAGTLEEKIDEMIEAKKSVAEAVVGTGEDWLTELGTDDLRKLLALREDALA